MTDTIASRVTRVIGGSVQRWLQLGKREPAMAASSG